MGEVRNRLQTFKKQALSLLKMITPTLLMYFCAGSVLMVLTMNKEPLAWNGVKLTWTLVCVLSASLYNGFLAFMQGGEGYDMLVTGNVLYHSKSVVEGGYKMSKYKPEKEYRVWKGFVAGGYVSLFIIFAGIVFGCNQATIDSQTAGTGLSILFIACVLTSGWSVLPFYYMNLGGASISYFVSLAFALLPIIVTGVCYVFGAYNKRAKELRKQAIADRARLEEEKKEKKINYGALPGTKPRKRK